MAVMAVVAAGSAGLAPYRGSSWVYGDISGTLLLLPLVPSVFLSFLPSFLRSFVISVRSFAPFFLFFQLTASPSLFFCLFLLFLFLVFLSAFSSSCLPSFLRSLCRLAFLSFLSFLLSSPLWFYGDISAASCPLPLVLFLLSLFLVSFLRSFLQSFIPVFPSFLSSVVFCRY